MAPRRGLEGHHWDFWGTIGETPVSRLLDKEEAKLSTQTCGCDPELNYMCEAHTKNLYASPLKLEIIPNYWAQKESKETNPKDLIGGTKVPLDLVPGTTKAYLAIGHLEGHLKYGLVNWREIGVKTSIYLAALERHIEKFKGGEWADPVTKVPHLANALSCLSIMVDAYECGKLVDDRPQGAPVSAVIDRMSENVAHLKELFGDKKPVDYMIDGPKQRA